VNRQKLKDAIEIVGVVAIVASLVFVALEVRQNTDAVKSSVIQAISDQSINALEIAIDNESLRQAQSAVASGTANDDQERQARLYYAMLVRIQQNRFMQSEIGTVDRTTALVLGGRSAIYRRPEFHEYWNSVKNSHPEDFRNFTERELLTLPLEGRNSGQD
jgi:hypothetical protein